jgi:hypothetical protein
MALISSLSDSVSSATSSTETVSGISTFAWLIDRAGGVAPARSGLLPVVYIRIDEKLSEIFGSKFEFYIKA